jgi:hypothetical protein
MAFCDLIIEFWGGFMAEITSKGSAIMVETEDENVKSPRADALFRPWALDSLRRGFELGKVGYEGSSKGWWFDTHH